MGQHWKNSAYVLGMYGVDMDKLTPSEGAELISSLANHFDILAVQYNRSDVLDRIQEAYIQRPEQEDEARELTEKVMASDEWASWMEQATEAVYDAINTDAPYYDIIHEVAKANGYAFLGGR